MKYLTLSLVITITSTHAAESNQECRAETNLNPNNRFSQHIITTDAGDYKVVNDTATGLQWSYCFVGQQLDGNQLECTGQPTVPYDFKAKDYVDVRQLTMAQVQQENQSLDARNQSWRLPNIKELLSIYNENCNPAIYPMFSYATNASLDDITELTSGRPAGDDKVALEEARAIEDIDTVSRIETATKYKGEAYKNYTVLSDTPLILRGYKPYYSINFKGWGNTFNNTPFLQSTGLLRLVREIPQP